jgi:two-component system cell cycle response regulator
MAQLQTERESLDPAAEAVGTLEEENRLLQERLVQLTEEVSRNDSLFRKTQERELELLRAGSLTQLFERLIQGLKGSYQLDGVTLVLHDPQHEIRHLLYGDEPAQPPPGVRFVDTLLPIAPQLAALERPWLGPFHRADHELLFAGVVPRGGSVALIPLRRHEQLDGVLVFVSNDPLRFTDELASDFLAHLGLVAAICVENAVNRARLLRSGLTDFLTGFHNRRYLHARLREELSRTQRARQSIVCLMIDVDHFKRINDRYGHAGGDAVLVEIADRLRRTMRDGDLVVRWGGEEVLVLAPPLAQAEAEALAHRILCALADMPVMVEGRPVPVSGSIGFASFPLQATTPSGELEMSWERSVALVDVAMYRVKKAGRNGACGIGRVDARTIEDVDAIVQSLQVAGQDARVDLRFQRGPALSQGESSVRLEERAQAGEASICPPLAACDAR